MGFQVPEIYKFWHDNWATLSNYFKYSEVIRRLIYTTNAIEEFNQSIVSEGDQKQDRFNIKHISTFLDRINTALYD